MIFLPYQCFPAPIPLTPFPAGRGDFRLFYARGFAPCIPKAGRGAALARPAVVVPGGGGFVSCEAGLRLRSDTRQGVAVRTRHW